MIECFRGIVRPYIAILVSTAIVIFEGYDVIIKHQPISEQFWAMAGAVMAIYFYYRQKEKAK